MRTVIVSVKGRQRKPPTSLSSSLLPHVFAFSGREIGEQKTHVGEAQRVHALQKEQERATRPARWSALSCSRALANSVAGVGMGGFRI